MKKFLPAGFTLVELLVVISIIAILSIIGLTIYTGVQKNARDAKRRGDLDALAKALAQYRVATGSYPAPSTDFFSIWNPHWTNSANETFYNALVTGGYIQALPLDPINKEGGAGNFLGDNSPTDLGYRYQASSNGSSFTLGTNLETDTTVEADNDASFGNYQIKNQL